MTKSSTSPTTISNSNINNTKSSFDFEDDEIMEEWDVFVGTELTPFLHLVPLPTQNITTRLSTTPTASSRFKPVARRLEITLPLRGSPQLPAENLNAAAMAGSSLVAGQKLVGTGWQWRRVQYLVGQFHSNELHLTPVESVIPLNPSFTHLDESSKSSPSTSSSGSSSRRTQSPEDLNSNTAAAVTTNNNTASNRAIQVQFRKKETEEQVQARLHSYAHLQRQVDDEEWIPLKHHSPSDPESTAVREKLISPCRELIEFVHDEDYLAKIIG